MTEEKVVEVVEEVKVEESLNETVEVGGKVYNLRKAGAEQAKQVSDLLNWLGNYGKNLATVFATDGNEDATENLGQSTWELLAAIGQVATQEALIDLFVVTVGCSKSVANKHFSIGTLVDGIEVLLSQEEYAKVINRFF